MIDTIKWIILIMTYLQFTIKEELNNEQTCMGPNW